MRAQSMASKNISGASNNLLHQQQKQHLHHHEQQQNRYTFGALNWQRGRLKSTHINNNESTSPPISEHRANSRWRQVNDNSMSKRQQQQQQRQTDDSSVGDLLRLTNLKLNDEDKSSEMMNTQTVNYFSAVNELDVQKDSMIDHSRQQQQQQQRQQLDDPQLTLLVSENGNQLHYSETYFGGNELIYHQQQHHHHHHQPTYFTNSSSADATFSQPTVYTTLIDEDIVLPESVIRLNEPRQLISIGNNEEEHRNDAGHQSHYSPNDSFSFHSNHDQHSDAQKSYADNDNHRKHSTSQSQQQQLELSEFRVCEWEGCEHTFDDMQQFVKHLEERHVNQNPREKNRYFCLWSNCKRNEQEFNARYKLLIHMRVHSGEKPYPCNNEDCKKTFSRLENLKIHQRSHTGEKPYKCSYENCSKSFTNSSDRIKHHKTHKDPRPYCCSQPGCAKRYTDPSSLRKHLRAHKRVIGATKSNNKGGDSLETPSQVPTNNNNNNDNYQHLLQQQLIPVNELHHQPTPTIIEATYDPCAMLFEHEQQQQQQQQLQSMACLAPEATYLSNQSLATTTYDELQQQQQSTIHRDNSSSSIANTSFNSAHHQHHHDQNQSQNQNENQHQQYRYDHHHQQHLHQHQQQHQQQQYLQLQPHNKQHLSVIAQSHTQFSRSWCAGSSVHPRDDSWTGSGGGVGSITPQVHHNTIRPHHSYSSSSLNSNSSQYPQTQLQLYEPNHPSQQQQQQQQQEQQQYHQPEQQFYRQKQQQQQQQGGSSTSVNNFLRPLTEEVCQTREVQHQSLMRSLPAQPARHLHQQRHDFRDNNSSSSRSSTTFGSSSAVCSLASDSPEQHKRQQHQRQHPEEYQHGNTVETNWYAISNSNRYEPHG